MKALFSASMSALLAGCAASSLPVSDSSASRPNAAIAPEPRSVGALSSAFRIEALDSEPSTAPSVHEHHHGATAEPPPSQGGKAGDTDAQVYTCPMHPEVVSKEQGACPKCGMTLVPKKKPAGAP